MPSVGSKIYAADYNALQSIIANVMGVGSGTYGYNQTVQSNQITIGGPVKTPIRLAQWLALRNDIVNAYTHLGLPGGLTVPPIPTNANKVTATDYNNYLAIVNNINNNSTNTPPALQASLTTLSNSTRSTPWNGTVTHSVILTFPSLNAARGFFNSGSNIQFAGSNTGYPADASYAKSNDWAMILANMGKITFNYNSTITNGGYTYRASNIGYYQLTTSPALIFQKVTTTSIYSPNQYDIYASVDASGTVLTFNIQFQTFSTDGSIHENVEGNLNSIVQAYYSTGSAVAATLPNVTSSGP
jgi:hypothetical protein